MHQIRFRLGLRPRPHWGAHSASPPLAGCKGSHHLTSKGNGETEGKKKGESMEGKGKGRGRFGTGRGRQKEGRGTERGSGNGENRKRGGGSWNRAAEWLRPALFKVSCRC